MFIFLTPSSRFVPRAPASDPRFGLFNRADWKEFWKGALEQKRLKEAGRMARLEQVGQVIHID